MRFRHAAAPCALLAALAATPAIAQRNNGTILWDQYAVPHIYAADIPSVIRGLGYAQMENDAETLLNNVARERGQLAQYFGPGTTDGNIMTDNIANDIAVQTYGIPARAAIWLQQGGALQRQYLQAFCDGVNEYAARYGAKTIAPQLLKILPVMPTDVLAGEQYTIWFTFLPETSNVPTLISDWQQGGMAMAKRKAAFLRPVSGSNGWAIGPSKTANGHAVLVGNPHLPWGTAAPPGGLGIYQWIEVNLVVGSPNAPSLNAQGVTFIGGPFIGIGFNDYLGWTHTNNTIKNADLYQLTLDSTGTKYQFDGNFLPLTHTTGTIQVLQNGALQPQTFDIYNAIQGPVVAFNTAHTQALALRVPDLNANHLVTQYWSMIEATSLKQFMAAESELQMPFFNTMYADRGGNIFYLFGGGQPNRGNPSLSFNSILGILDGTTSSTFWTQTLPFSQLPQAINPKDGFIANSNNPPWNTAFDNLNTFTPPPGLNPANFPAYISPQFMEFRPQHGTTFLADHSGLTDSLILGGKMSTEMYLADRVVPDLIALGNGGDANAKAAAAILSAWDHTGEAGSVGGLLFENWWNRVTADVLAGTIQPDTSNSLYFPHPKFRVPWSASAPITTPSGLDPVNDTMLLAELDNAYIYLQSTFASLGGASAPWGALHETTLVTRSGLNDEGNIFPFLVNTPNSGADDVFGPLRVTDSQFVSVPGLLNQFISYGGDGYVQELDFGPTGPTGGTLLTYGNASRPNSPHITDQLPFYNSKTLKPVLRSYSAVQAATVKNELY